MISYEERWKLHCLSHLELGSAKTWRMDHREQFYPGGWHGLAFPSCLCVLMGPSTLWALALRQPMLHNEAFRHKGNTSAPEEGIP